MSIKSEKALALWERAKGRCPLCGGDLAVEGGGLVCPENHRFDMARQGYVQLMKKKGNAALYDGALFAARRRMLSLGLFTPALDGAADLLDRAIAPGELWLDAGCGEGWATAHLAQSLPDRLAMGLDLAPAGVKMAAASWGGQMLWSVADLAHIPLKDNGAAAVVNLLSPAHYGEFGRILGEEGLLVKWIPGAGHLEQLRRAAGLSPAGDSKALEAFQQHCRVLGIKRIVATVKLASADVEAAVWMAPFTKHRRTLALEALADETHPSLTSDLYLAWGRILPGTCGAPEGDGEQGPMEE